MAAIEHHLGTFGGKPRAPKSSGTVSGVKYSRRTSSADTKRTRAAYFFSHCSEARRGQTRNSQRSEDKKECRACNCSAAGKAWP